MRFHLHKWYLDCVSPAGHAGVAYAADLRLGPLDLGYSAVLRPGTAPTRRWVHSRPTVEGAQLRWACGPLGARGTWGALQPLDTVVLLEGADGSIHWRVHQPSGPAELEGPGGDQIVGQGYAEELTLSLPPWRLPFSELRWGRFISDAGHRSLVWIDWREGLTRRWCLLDGRPVTVLDLTDAALRWEGGHLQLDAPLELHRSRLGRDLFGRAAGLAALLPRGLGAVEEVKWVARGRLEAPEPTVGWTIHEVVRWR